MAGRHAGEAVRATPLTSSAPDALPDPLADPLPDPLPELGVADLETLLAALDPRLDGFGSGASCLDDASAFLARLGIQAEPEAGEGGEAPLLQWLERWRAAGGNRETLRLMAATLLARLR